MKILMVFTSKFHYTGITSVVMNYYRYIIKDDEFNIDFVVPNDISKEYKEELKNNNSNIFKIDMSIRRKRPIKYIIQLKKIIKENNYDIVHVHGSSSIMYYELLAAKVAGCNGRIAHCHNTVTEHPIIHKILFPLFSNSYTDAFACGDAAGKWLFKDKKYYILPNAQNIEKFRYNEDVRNEFRNKYDLNNKKVIGHVGAFNFQKNHEFLIDVFSKVHKKNNEYFLILIGEGELMDKIKNKVSEQKLDDAVLFVGRTTEVNKWLNVMDIMVLPSNYEGFPNVLVEWQIAGLPCIVSDKVTKAVQLTDLVQFECLDIDKWSDKILHCNGRSNNNENNIIKLRDEGFDIEENVKKLKSKYKEICSRGE